MRNGSILHRISDYAKYNDIQQIQMVSVLLRMIAYAPILGIKVAKVVKTGPAWAGHRTGNYCDYQLCHMLLVSITMPKFKQMQKLVDNINLVSREILTGLSVIRIQREDKEEERLIRQTGSDRRHCLPIVSLTL